MAWLETWAKRVKLTIDNGDIGASLAHFPITVFINDSAGISDDDISIILDDLDGSLYKIAFTKDNGTTQLYAEVESWTATLAVIHISIASLTLASGSPTVLYMYWDPAQDNNTTYIGIKNTAGRDGPRESVWNSNFVMVQHMETQPLGSTGLQDSTSNDADALHKKIITGPTEVTGKVGIAMGYNHVGGNFGAYDDLSGGVVGALLHEADEVTIEGWLNITDLPSGSGNRQYICSIGYWGSNIGVGLYLDSTTAIVAEARSSIAEAYDPHVIAYLYSTEDTWVYIGAVYDFAGDEIRIYANGVLVATNSDARFDIGTFNFIGVNANDGIASGMGGAFQWFGLLDELRISKVSRSIHWFLASYETQRDHFIEYSVVDENYESTATIELEVDVTAVHSITPAGVIAVTSTMECEVDVRLGNIGEVLEGNSFITTVLEGDSII